MQDPNCIFCKIASGDIPCAKVFEDETAIAFMDIGPLAEGVKSVMGCEGVNVLQNNGKAAHQEVPHVHFHLIPRNTGDAFHFNWPAGSYREGRAAELAASIRAEL